jgi:hypothetical protein
VLNPLHSKVLHRGSTSFLHNNFTRKIKRGGARTKNDDKNNDIKDYNKKCDGKIITKMITSEIIKKNDDIKNYKK